MTRRDPPESAEATRRAPRGGAFGRHLPAEVLSQVAWSTVFTVADQDLSRGDITASEASTASLVLLGVPGPRAEALAQRRP